MDQKHWIDEQGIIMKKLMIVLLTLGSISANAAEDCSLKLSASSPRLEKRVARILQNKGYNITDKEAAFELRINVGNVDGGYSQDIFGGFMALELPYHYAYGDVYFEENGGKKIASQHGQGMLFINAEPIFKIKALGDVRDIPNCNEI